MKHILAMDTFKIKSLLIFIFLLYASAMVAQNTVKGAIKGENSQEAVYASVRLLRTDSTFVQGAITDSIGNYRFSDVAAGDYLLSISSMGYVPQLHTLSVGNQEKQLPLFVLKESSVMLGEVEVKGSSFIRQKDRVLIIPEEQQIKHSSTGYDLLYNLMIPGVSVNSQKGTVSTLLGEATLYINGQKADYREIRALRPKDIEKIEYFEMPTGKYAGDKASINYILKEKHTGGYLALDGTQTIGYLGGDYNASLKVTHKNTNYTLFAGHSMERNDGIRTEKEETFHFSEKEINRTTHVDDSQLKKNNQYIQLNINNSNDKRTLAGKFFFVRQDMPDNYSRNTLAYTGTSAGTLNSTNETNQTGLMPGVNLYGNFLLSPTQNLDVNLNAIYTNNDYTRRYSENNFRSSILANEDLYNIDFSTNYLVQLKHNNSFGLNLSHLHRVSSSAYQGDRTDWNHLWTAETLLMGQYNQSIGNLYFSLQFGGDLLQYRVHGNEAKRYLSPHANVLLNYRIAPNHSVMYGLNTGNSNPPMEWVSDVSLNVDSLTVKRGNPHLKKTNYYISYLVYSFQKEKINMQVSAYYFGAINSTFSDYYIEGNKLVNSFHTDGDFHQLRGGVSFTYKILPNLHARLSGFYRYNKISGKTEAQRNEWGGSADVNYYWKDFTFNIHGKSTGKTLENTPAFIDTPATYGAFARWNHNNWMVEAGTDNTFSKQNQTKMYMNTNAYCFYNNSYSDTYQKTGYVKLAYTFDFGKKTSKDQRDVTPINSAILKTE